MERRRGEGERRGRKGEIEKQLFILETNLFPIMWKPVYFKENVKSKKSKRYKDIIFKG